MNQHSVTHISIWRHWWFCTHFAMAIYTNMQTPWYGSCRESPIQYDSYVVLFVWFEGSIQWYSAKLHISNALTRQLSEMRSAAAPIHHASAKCKFFRGLSGPVTESIHFWKIHKIASIRPQPVLHFINRIKLEIFLSPIFFSINALQPCPSTVTYCCAVSCFLRAKKNAFSVAMRLRTWDNGR